MTEKRTGKILKINGNMVTVEMESFVVQNEVAYIIHGKERLKSEVIRIKGRLAEMQVYENTGGLKIGEKAEFSNELLSVELGPGLLGQIFDGLQNPLPQLADKCGFFLERGIYLDALKDSSEWEFTPLLGPGNRLRAGDKLGFVPEKIFKHFIMAPFNIFGALEVVSIAKAGKYNLKDTLARLRDDSGRTYECFLKQSWPVKIPIEAYSEKLMPAEPLVTKMRLIDS
ncbi:MAG: V-type ATP synthase subunit A, partial [Candidatus Omnitrophota bacterium]|nr:V-type ATP synthase subunit A [Candidatus Omnitrophota bacterium]